MLTSILGPQRAPRTLVALIYVDRRGKTVHYLYLAVFKETVRATLVREEEKVQWPIYYVSNRLLDIETRYLELEKLALALVVPSRKLRPYFQAYSIES